MVSIQTVLKDKIQDFINSTNRNPVHLYLGKNEWNLLMIWAEENYGYKPDPKDKDVPEYLGLKTYRVHINDHCVVA